MLDSETPVSFPHYVVTHMTQPGDNPKHLVETVMSNLWASAECAHVFELAWSVEDAQWVCAWILAPSTYWEAFLEQIRQEGVQAVQEVLEGFEDLLTSAAARDILDLPEQDDDGDGRG